MELSIIHNTIQVATLTPLALLLLLEARCDHLVVLHGTLKLILCCGVLHARLLPSGYCNGNSGAHVQGGRQLDLTSR